MRRIKQLGNRALVQAEKMGNVLVDTFHLIGLFVIGGTIVWSAAVEYVHIMGQGYASLKDILMLFIYLELGAMVGIYFKTHRLPVRFLLYIAITALTRVLAVDVKTMDTITLLSVTGAIFILSVAVLVIRAGSHLFRDDGADSKSANKPEEIV